MERVYQNYYIHRYFLTMGSDKLMLLVLGVLGEIAIKHTGKVNKTNTQSFNILNSTNVNG